MSVIKNLLMEIKENTPDKEMFDTSISEREVESK